MKMYYNHLENNSLLFELERNKIFCEALLYLVTFKKHTSFNVIPHPHSIEVYNNTVSVFIILYVGYEKLEYLQHIHDDNVHIISFSRIIVDMCEFKKTLTKVKFITPYAIFFTALDIAPDDIPIGELKYILNIK